MAPIPCPLLSGDFLVRSNACFPDLANDCCAEGGMDIEYAVGAGLLFLVYHAEQWAFVDKVRQSLPRRTALEMLEPGRRGPRGAARHP